MSEIPVYIKEEDEYLYNTLLNIYLRDNVSQNGIVAPSRKTSDITELSNTMPDGTLWYDSDTDEIKVRINGTIRIVQLV